MKQPLYIAIASTLLARKNCEQQGNALWFERHTDRLGYIARQRLPAGSGFDCGTAIDIDRSTPDRLVLTTSYHHMAESGYVGWSYHTVYVTPSLVHGFDLRIVTHRSKGRRVDAMWLDHAHEVFRADLEQVGSWSPEGAWRVARD